MGHSQWKRDSPLLGVGVLSILMRIETSEDCEPSPDPVIALGVIVGDEVVSGWPQRLLSKNDSSPNRIISPDRIP